MMLIKYVCGLELKSLYTFQQLYTFSITFHIKLLCNFLIFIFLHCTEKFVQHLSHISVETSLEPVDKLQLEYKSIMRTDQSVSVGRFISFNFIWSLKND